MKKKLLLAVAMIAMLVCIFAISASASVIYKDTNGKTLFTAIDENNDRIFESYEGNFPETDESGNALTWYITSTETVDADTVYTVSNFMTIDTTGEHASLSENGVYKYVNQAKELSIVSAYFPDNSNVLTLSMSDDGYGNAYGYDKDESNILFLRLPNTLTELPKRIVQATPIIKCVIADTAPLTSFSCVSFYRAKNLRSVNIPSNVTILYSNGHQNDGHTFYECVSLVEVKFSENSHLETIQQNAFNSCTALKELTIPNSVINLEQRAFQNCKSLETIRLGANAGVGLTEYNVQSMLYQCSSLKYVYMSSTMVPAKGSHLFNDGASGMVIFYTGDYTQYETLKSTLTTLGNNGKFVNATPIEWDSANDDQYYKDLAATEGKNYVVYGYNQCNAFYNAVHTEKTEDNNPCWLNECNVCGIKNVYSGNNSTHNFTTEIIYEDYMSDGVKKTYCTNEKCLYPTEEITLPCLFVLEGYSSNDNGEMCVSYRVDTSAIKVYTDFYGETLTFKYGIVVAANSVNPYDLTENVVKIDLSKNEYTAIDFRLSGFTDATKDAPIAMNMYVAETRGDKTAVKYLTSMFGTSDVAEMVTYNTVPKENEDNQIN